MEIYNMEIKKFFICLFYIILNINCSYSQVEDNTCDYITNKQELLICEKSILQSYNDKLKTTYYEMYNKLISQRDYYVANRAMHFEKSQKYWELTTESFCKYKAISDTDNDPDVAFISCLGKATKARINSIKTDMKNLKIFKK